jgi:hypothetical protein
VRQGFDARAVAGYGILQHNVLVPMPNWRAASIFLPPTSGSTLSNRALSLEARGLVGGSVVNEQKETVGMG